MTRKPGWYIVDHENEDLVLRGPYEEATHAGLVRSEMERNEWASKGNLWIVPESYFDEPVVEG